MVKFEVTCPFCGKKTEVSLTEEEYERVQSGQYLIQDALPNRTATERELVKTGMCVECQNDVFGGE